MSYGSSSDLSLCRAASFSVRVYDTPQAKGVTLRPNIRSKYMSTASMIQPNNKNHHSRFLVVDTVNARVPIVRHSQSERLHSQRDTSKKIWPRTALLFATCLPRQQCCSTGNATRVPHTHSHAHIQTSKHRQSSAYLPSAILAEARS